MQRVCKVYGSGGGAGGGRRAGLGEGCTAAFDEANTVMNIKNSTSISQNLGILVSGCNEKGNWK